VRCTRVYLTTEFIYKVFYSNSLEEAITQIHIYRFNYNWIIILNKKKGGYQM